MERAARSRLPALAVAAGMLLAPAAARATNVTEVPDNGSEQMGRGGAWVARASDPLATIYNPAGLAGQRSRVTIQSNAIFEHTCLSRIKAGSDTTNDPLAGPGGVYPRACNDLYPSINPQIGATVKLGDRLGLGLLVIGPSSPSSKTFPDFVADGNGQLQAAPSRYLLVERKGLVLFPTVGVGYEVTGDLRIGASFSWGLSRLSLTSALTSLNVDNAAPAGDMRATVQVKDYFIPMVTLGALWSATRNLDVAAWAKWTDAIRATGDVGTAANYYTRQNAAGDDGNVRYGDTIFDDCGTGTAAATASKPCGSGGNARVKFVIPMEAKLGLRYHVPRSAGASGPARRVRDPLASDVFDVEADFTWANNSAADTIQIRFPGDATGRGTLPVAGVAGGDIPPNADQLRGYKDVVGVRVGGDYNVLPDRLALRGGTFVEASAAQPRLQNIDFAAGARVGLALGATYRLRIGEGDDSRALELMVGYGHVFFADQTLRSDAASGAAAISGTSCNGVIAVPGTQTCADGTARYRSKWPVNLGTITNSVNLINVGAAYRF